MLREMTGRAALGRSSAPSFLHQNIQHDPVLVQRAPQIVQRTPDVDEHLVQVPRVPGSGTRRRSLLAKSAPNFRYQCRTLSPRSARISSTWRRLRLNTSYSPTADDLSRKAVSRIGGGLWCHAVSLARFPSRR